jgi:DivIVA domain-containing protein
MGLNEQEIEAHEFAMVRRGYHPDEVRSYLREVATAIRNIPGRAYVDVGDRVASVFASADKAAAEITETAAREADARRLEVDAYVNEQRELADAYVGEQRQLADAYVNEQRQLGETALRGAEQRAAAMLAEAQRECAELKDAAEREAMQMRLQATEIEISATAETQRVRAEADEYVSQQTATADRMRSEVEERVAMIEKKAHHDLAEAHAAGDRILDNARDDAEQLVSDAQREAVEIVLAAERKAAVRTDTVLRNAHQRLEIMVSAEREVFDRMARAFDALRGADIDGLAVQPALPATTSNGGYNQNYLDQ